MGSVQRLTKINVNDSDSRILSVKLRGDLLVTLTEVRKKNFWNIIVLQFAFRIIQLDYITTI